MQNEKISDIKSQAKKNPSLKIINLDEKLLKKEDGFISSPEKNSLLLDQSNSYDPQKIIMEDYSVSSGGYSSSPLRLKNKSFSNYAIEEISF